MLGILVRRLLPWRILVLLLAIPLVYGDVDFVIGYGMFWAGLAMLGVGYAGFKAGRLINGPMTRARIAAVAFGAGFTYAAFAVLLWAWMRAGRPLGNERLLLSYLGVLDMISISGGIAIGRGHPVRDGTDDQRPLASL